MKKFENKFCQIVFANGLYVLQSKLGRYQDKEFYSLELALNYIGLSHFETMGYKKAIIK